MTAALLLTLQTFAAPAPEVRWERIGAEADYTLYIAPESILDAGGTRRWARARAVLTATLSNGVAVVLLHFEIDCAAHVGHAIETQALNAQGEVIGQTFTPEGERRPEPNRPGTIEAAVETRVCGAALR